MSAIVTLMQIPYVTNRNTDADSKCHQQKYCADFMSAIIEILIQFLNAINRNTDADSKSQRNTDLDSKCQAEKI